MKHLLKRNNTYYYNRRVPDNLKTFDPRPFIRMSLKTDSRDIAVQRCVMLNQNIESYWATLIESNNTHSASKFQNITKLTRHLGFSYMPNAQLANAHMQELVIRAAAIERHAPSLPHITGLAGGEDIPLYTVTDALEQFWHLSKDRILNKSPNQIRKWQNPRKKAVQNFVKVNGNKNLIELTRDDIMKFRDWWIQRVKEGKSPGSANKDLIHFKNIVETINDHERLGIETDWLFRKITLKERFAQRRKPLKTPFIRNTLLQPNNLKGLEPQARCFLYAMAETGARLSELTGLKPEDIKLNAEIPFIHIRDKPNRPLKTPHSERTIPLVGYALLAFKECPDGFPDYRNLPDRLSNTLNKYLRQHDLLPSKDHTVYSLRHSFQDRLLQVNTPDRVQAELMGHKFNRPKYGDGASLEQKRDWLLKICLR